MGWTSRITRLAFGAALIACATQPAGAETLGIVKIESGQLAGHEVGAGQVTEFRGVPYAAPPVGDKRWRAPEKPLTWDGARLADKNGAACMQQTNPPNSVFYFSTPAVSEDCLSLNIWTPARSATERRPVMVWFHGGGFRGGTGSAPNYDGDQLAKMGVVVVTINYRLGVFGFLAHPDLATESPKHVSGNYGFLDQIAALEWVKRNIAAFGGDPARVTIFGQSAGSFSVNYLMASPLAKGLFRGAIGESGATFSPVHKGSEMGFAFRTMADAEQDGVAFAKQEKSDSIASLRAKPAAEILKAAQKSKLAMRPIVDGSAFPTDVYTIFAQGKQNDVPLLTGSNANEGSIYVRPTTAAAYVERAKKQYGDLFDDYIRAYPAGSDQQATQSAQAAFRDATFAWHNWAWARAQATTGKSKVHYYYLDHPPPIPLGTKFAEDPEGSPLGTYHTAEILYVFHHFNLRDWKWSAADRRLADQLAGYWINFARSGDPNAHGLPDWPAFDNAGQKVLHLGTKIEIGGVANSQQLQFWENYFARARAVSTQAAR